MQCGDVKRNTGKGVNAMSEDKSTRAVQQDLEANSEKTKESSKT